MKDIISTTEKLYSTIISSIKNYQLQSNFIAFYLNNMGVKTIKKINRISKLDYDIETDQGLFRAELDAVDLPFCEIIKLTK